MCLVSIFLFVALYILSRFFGLTELREAFNKNQLEKLEAAKAA